MPKADRLLVLKVDTGLDVRTIVSGLAEHFNPEDIIGKRVTVLVNLAPRKLRGVESEGMILMTENEEGGLVFINPDNEDRKSTRLNSSHVAISYAVFCLKKKKKHCHTQH